METGRTYQANKLVRLRRREGEAGGWKAQGQAEQRANILNPLAPSSIFPILNGTLPINFRADEIQQQQQQQALWRTTIVDQQQVSLVTREAVGRGKRNAALCSAAES